MTLGSAGELPPPGGVKAAFGSVGWSAHPASAMIAFDTNVVGAALVTAAALPHLAASNGVAVYLSSVSASLTPPWPGLGAYTVGATPL